MVDVGEMDDITIYISERNIRQYGAIIAANFPCHILTTKAPAHVA